MPLPWTPWPARAARSPPIWRGESTSEWLASEIRLRGIRENAAVLAVMEIPEYRYPAAQAYALRYPDRLKVLNDLLAVLT
jgi:hypothetical protein